MGGNTCLHEDISLPKHTIVERQFTETSLKLTQKENESQDQPRSIEVIGNYCLMAVYISLPPSGRITTMSVGGPFEMRWHSSQAMRSCCREGQLCTR